MAGAMSDYDDALATFRVVPLLVLHDINGAAPAANALVEGGLPFAEIALRTASSLECLRIIAKQPGMLAGAGTVVTAAQVDQAVAAGARFIVSPGISRDVVERARQLDVALLPGVATSSEIMHALDLGFERVKLFPVEPLGGLRLVRALAGPFPALKVVPSGGLTPEHLAPYLHSPTVQAVGASWITAPELLQTGDYAEISRRAAEVTQLVNGLT
jgi:2-dehydro-3-deoxyphosphogluconate aldolase / (4S)-4-hydroxy-2-oxoglutarate aldolase